MPCRKSRNYLRVYRLCCYCHRQLAAFLRMGGAMATVRGRRLQKCPKGEDVLHYWPELIEGMRFSTKDFYDRTEAALQARNIPELEVSRVDIKEGGPLTPRREYLRLRRERLVFDICAMPFGSGFYISEWFWRQPRRIGLIALLVLGALIWLGWTIATNLNIPWGVERFFWFKLGIRPGFLELFLTIAIPVVTVFGGVVLSVLWFGEALDGMMMRIPLFGHVYERWLRRVTYYREDRTAAFQAAAHSALCSVIDDICKTQGIAPLSDAAKRPMHPQIKATVGPLRRKPETQPVG